MKILLNSPYLSSGLYQPIRPGSLIHIQNAYTEALVALAKGLMFTSYNGYDPSTPYAIYNFPPTIGGSPTMYNIPETWIFFNGVLYYAPATSLSYPLASGHDYVATVSTSYFTSSIADPITMSDGATTDYVHQINNIQWSIATTGSGLFSSSAVIGLGIIPSELGTINTDRSVAASILGTTSNLVDQTLASDILLGTWHTLGTSGSTISTGWNTSTLAPKFISDGLGRIRMTGGLLCPTASSISGFTLCTLPTGYRPPSITLRFISYAILSSNPVPICITISNTGVVSFQNASINDGDSIYFDNISFLNS